MVSQHRLRPTATVAMLGSLVLSRKNPDTPRVAPFTHELFATGALRTRASLPEGDFQVFFPGGIAAGDTIPGRQAR